MCTASPLNRLSFFRTEHDFLGGAFDHPSAVFMVFNNLSPLIDSPTAIHYVKRDEIKTLLAENPYSHSEKDMISNFDSRKVIPDLVFLGIDEKVKDGYHYRNYTGAPHFAINVTPKAPYEQAATEFSEDIKKKGLSFVEGMRAMNFPPDIGE